MLSDGQQCGPSSGYGAADGFVVSNLTSVLDKAAQYLQQVTRARMQLR